MKVAVNYSPAVERLVKESLIEIDYYKCPDFSKDLIFQAEQSKASYVHFALNAGSNRMENVNWEHIEDLRVHTQTPFFNVHAVAFARDYPGVDIFTADTKHIHKMVDYTVRDIEIVAERAGAENVIVENVICRGKGENMMQPIIDPKVIREIVEKTGCGFLLDTAHARMTSMCLGMDVKEYISQFPLDHLKELHITGIQADENGRLRDSMPMTKADWDLASWAIQRIKDGDWPEPWAAALEYGGVGPKFEWRTDEAVLEKQVPILYEMVR
ncbi:DUF692 family multinuclear iron-containing protein [Virgibacillus doumboii]|uniref:multinuclear nonheme iron-dependent oxidase n=1 Tax=Virgibacillus doumboii TaxID=2697503 RepID=UPI0013DE9B0C|nr:DUF692 family multinuclear iron-containing protein [Virgibacillus doumboii]